MSIRQRAALGGLIAAFFTMLFGLQTDYAAVFVIFGGAMAIFLFIMFVKPDDYSDGWQQVDTPTRERTTPLPQTG